MQNSSLRLMGWTLKLSFSLRCTCLLQYYNSHAVPPTSMCSLFTTTVIAFITIIGLHILYSLSMSLFIPAALSFMTQEWNSIFNLLWIHIRTLGRVKRFDNLTASVAEFKLCLADHVQLLLIIRYSNRTLGSYNMGSIGFESFWILVGLAPDAGSAPTSHLCNSTVDFVAYTSWTTKIMF